MRLTPGHPAKDWWRDSTAGERIYNLPPQLAEFTVPPTHRGIHGLRGTPSQAELLLHLNASVHDPLASAADAMTEVARYSRSDYEGLATELNALFEAENHIERMIANAKLPISASDADRVISAIDELAPQVEAFKQRVKTASRTGIEAGSLRTTLFAVAAGAAAVGAGWYLFAYRKRSRQKRK